MDQVEFCREVIRLAGQHLQITRAAVLIQHLRQLVGCLCCAREEFLLLAEFTIFLRSDERIGNLFKRVLNGLLIRELCFLPIGAGEPEVGAERSSLEDWLTYIKGSVPSLRGLSDELVQRVTLQSSQSGERQVRKERGFGDADLRVGSDHDLLGLADVRSAIE